MLQDHGKSVDEMAKIDGVVILEESRDRDKVVSNSVEHGLIIGKSDLGVLGEYGLELAEALRRDVETDGVVDTAELLEKSLADETDADNTDQSLVIVLLRDVLVSKGSDERVLPKGVRLRVDENHFD